MTIADQGTVFSPGQNPSQHNQVAPLQMQPRRLPTIAIVLILLVLAGAGSTLYYFFGLKMQERTKRLFEDATAKIAVVEEYGYNAQEYYAKLSGADRKIASSGQGAFLWYLFAAESELEGLNKQINSQYSSVLKQEQDAFNQDLAELERKHSIAQEYRYPSQDEVQGFLFSVKDVSAKGELSVEQVSDYRQQIKERDVKVTTETRAKLNDCKDRLKSNLATSVNFTIAKRDEWITYTTSLETRIEAMEFDMLVAEIKTCEDTIGQLLSSMERAKRDLVLTNVTAALSEADTLLAFFSKRSGFTEQIAKLNQLKSSATNLITVKSVEASSTQLQQLAATDVYPVLETTRTKKQEIEEQERQALLAEQKRREQESGIPVPPIDVPKLILIEIAKQRLYAYENGISIFPEPVPVTTGKAGFETVRGQFAIYLKTTNFRMRSPFPGIFYDNMVTYWMPFYQGYGLHDASWRTVYGTMDYLSVGSHGCVNTPFDKIAQLYQWAEVGTTVLVQ
jgi:lipoprotein-anchoring transpeptidase ErfK/SrfK